MYHMRQILIQWNWCWKKFSVFTATCHVLAYPFCKAEFCSFYVTQNEARASNNLYICLISIKCVYILNLVSHFN